MIEVAQLTIAPILSIPPLPLAGCVDFDEDERGNVAVAKPMRARNLESLGRPGDARAYDFSGRESVRSIKLAPRARQLPTQLFKSYVTFRREVASPISTPSLDHGRQGRTVE
jgi:hypothetical protein